MTRQTFMSLERQTVINMKEVKKWEEYRVGGVKLTSQKNCLKGISISGLLMYFQQYLIIAKEK